MTHLPKEESPNDAKTMKTIISATRLRLWVVLQVPMPLQGSMSPIALLNFRNVLSHYSIFSPFMYFSCEHDTCSCCFCPETRVRLKDPGPRVPLTTYRHCVSVRLSLCRILILFVVPLFISCDKHACPLDPPGGLRTAVSREPF